MTDYMELRNRIHQLEKTLGDLLEAKPLDRISYLEMKVAGRVTTTPSQRKRTDYSKCICSMEGMPADFNASPDCPIHGDPKVLAQLHQHDIDSNSAYCLDAPQCEEQPNLRSDEQITSLATRFRAMLEAFDHSVSLSDIHQLSLKLGEAWKEVFPISDPPELTTAERVKPALSVLGELYRPMFVQLELCIKCGHSFDEHLEDSESDGQGCRGIIDREAAINAFQRCHCQQFTTALECEAPKNVTFNTSRVGEILEHLPRKWWGVECKLCQHAFQAHYSPDGCAGNHPDGGQCRCGVFTTDHPEIVTRAEQSKSYWAEPCGLCGHIGKCHQNRSLGIGCTCVHSETTKVSQFESCLQWVQSEHSSPYGEHQSSGHFQCKSLHGQIVEDLLARMGNTSKSNLLEALAQERERFSRTWLALSKCEEAECRGVRRLVALALSNPLPE